MIDKYVFSDGQALGTLSTTGVVSTNVWDIEDGAVTDGQIVGWFCISIRSSTNAAVTGLDIQVRTSDAAAMTTTPIVVVAANLLQAEIAAGTVICIGLSRANLKKYIGIWYKADTIAMSNATAIDAWFQNEPITETGIQKS